MPQPSVTISSTVVTWLAWLRLTVTGIDGGWAGSGTVVGVAMVAIGLAGSSTTTLALLSRVNCSEKGWLLPCAQLASRAVKVVCSVPALGATCTPTFGRGYGVGVIVGVGVRVWVGVGLGVPQAAVVGTV